MSLKINNDTITISDLTGGNSDTRYFNSDITQLVPNKTGYKLFGSPLQRQQLKQFVNDSFAHNINYEPKITNIVDPGDNTPLYNSVSKTYTMYSDFSTSKYIKTLNNFNPGNNSYSITLGIVTGNNSSTNATFISENTNYSFSFGIANSKLTYYLSSNGTSWTTSSDTGSTTLSANTKYYLKFDYDSVNQIFTSRISLNKHNWTTDYTSSKVNAPTNFLQFGVSRTVVSPFNGKIVLEDINIKINDTIWFDGESVIEGTDYEVVGSPTVTTETFEVSTPLTFTLSFNVNSSTFTQGTKYLLEHPNLIKVKTENNDIYFNFPWRNNNWCNVASPKMFYAYTDGNGNTIYTPDENLQGTFKSLNTNTFGNDGISIDSDGIAHIVADSSTPAYYVGAPCIYVNFSAAQPSDTYDFVYKVKVNQGTDYRTGFAYSTTYATWAGWAGYPTGTATMMFLESVVPCWFASRLYKQDYSQSQGVISTAANIGQFDKLEIVYDNTTDNKTYFKVNDTVVGQNDNYYGRWELPSDDWQHRIGPRVNENNTLNASYDIDLKESYLIIAGQKLTYAILNTTSNLYDSNFQQITPTTVENYNDVVVIDGTTYTRDTSKDGIKNVSVLTTGTNSISLIASDSQGGETEADQIKLIVNNHNFTLVASGEDMPLITTGVLGYKEDLIF